MFRHPRDLAALYPPLVHLAMAHFSSPDVMRFLGQKVHGGFQGEIVSEFKDRPEGIRVRHSVAGNSVKMYDKQGSVLRVETTLHDPQHLKVYRSKQGDPQGPRAWRPLRKGVADLHRWAEVSQRANQRYLDALAAVEETTPLGDWLATVTRPTRIGTQRVRGLRPWDDQDLALLRAVSRGEFVLRGFRNRELVPRLFATPARTPAERRSRSAKVTRKLRLLRAHGLIQKIPKTHRYQVTARGRALIHVVLAATAASVQKLLQAA